MNLRHDLPPWLDGAWERLAAMLAADRVPHALLLHGPGGIGKRHLAEKLVGATLCEEPRPDPCGACRSCHLLQAGNHLDFRRIEPEEGGAGIAIGPVRELINDFHLAAAGSRVAIIVTVETMNQAAANAFLKTLEEPAAGVMFVLTSDAPGRVPATVRSRCRKMALPPPTVAEALAWLEPTMGAPLAGRLLDLAGGSPLTARALLEHHDEDALSAVHDRTIALLEGRADPLEVAERWRKADDGRLVLAALFAALGAVARQGTADPDRLYGAVDDVLNTHRQRLEVPGLGEQLLYEGLALRCARAAAA